MQSASLLALKWRRELLEDGQPEHTASRNIALGVKQMLNQRTDVPQRWRRQSEDQQYF